MKSILIAAILTAGIVLAGTNSAQNNSLAQDSLPPEDGSLHIIQENSILPISAPPVLRVSKRIPVVVTAYSSSPQETDDDPFTTAAGTKVRDGIIANNLLYFGTKIRFPELYGDKVFVIEDRMASYKGYYHFDIWFADKQKALNFGAKNTYIEILN